jgi:LPS-assembly protein
MYDIRLALHSDLFRIFSPARRDDLAFRHNVRPEIIYEYIPHQGQDTHPFFEFPDRIEKKNLLTYAVTNTLTAKSGGKYWQFCRLRLEQSYDIAEEKEDSPSERKNGEERQPFSPLHGEIELAPLSFASLEADAEWSVYENDFESRNIGLNLWDGRGDRMFVEHRYTKDSNESLYADIFVRVSERLSLRADYELNMRDDREIRNGLGFSYDAACWSAEFRHSYEADDRKYAFVLNLHGLGGIGGGR